MNGTDPQKQAVLITSFGTTHQKTWENTIGAVESEIRHAFPQTLVTTAYTSPRVRRTLAKQGFTLPGPQEALEMLLQQGFEEVLVQPTFLLCGEEYHTLLTQLRPYTSHLSLRVGLPLLADAEDIRQAASLLSRRYPTQEWVCTLFIGHGTAHPANAVYTTFAGQLQAFGRNDCFVTTLEGKSPLGKSFPQIAKQFHTARLVPLLLTAGVHVQEDIAGEGPDSLQSQLQAAGLQVFPHLQGLGEDPDFRAFYVRHLLGAKPLCM